MSEEERDSRGYPIEHMRRSVARYMETRGYSEQVARGVVEAQYDEDMKIFACIEDHEKSIDLSDPGTPKKLSP